MAPSDDVDLEMKMVQLASNLADRAQKYSNLQSPPPRYSQVYSSESLAKITGVRLPCKDPSSLWDVSIEDGRISSIDPYTSDSSGAHDPRVLDGSSRLLAPSLCHAHIHLDKCFLLQDPKYSELQIESGDFGEAMDLTGKAKSMFEHDDLLRRGTQLIEESIQHGVTSMRAFVEVDGGVQFKCLDVGLALKEEFVERIEIQICAFAQLPLFSGPDGGEEVRRLMAEAAGRHGVDVIGSTPYVEQDEAKMKMNVRWVTMLALRTDKFLDLHLDYFVEEDKQPLIWAVLDIVKSREWTERKGKRITLGHCTRLTLLEPHEWHRLREEIGGLPISFVGLPTSDLFMMRTKSRIRGTLHIPDMVHGYGLDAAIAINNVGNAFTPQGNCDPLSVVSLGVGVYQAGTKKDVELLYECVSSRAKAAIGLEGGPLGPRVGDAADFVLFDRTDVGWRQRKTIKEIVYDAGQGRQTIYLGKLTTF